MDDFTLYHGLTIYGPLGIVTLYFMYKDFSVSKEHKEAIREFTQVLHEIKGRIGL